MRDDDDGNVMNQCQNMNDIISIHDIYYIIYKHMHVNIEFLIVHPETHQIPKHSTSLLSVSMIYIR